jgi:hypothetical protein
MQPARWATACALALVAAAAATAPGHPASAAPPDDTFAVYAGNLNAGQMEQLRTAGIDTEESVTPAGATMSVETVGRRPPARGPVRRRPARP